MQYDKIITESFKLSIQQQIFTPDNYLVPVLGTFFRLLANCFVLFRSDLDVVIFSMPLADIRRPK